MVSLLVLAVAALQGTQVSVRVDRDDVLVGDEVVVTIRVETFGNAPVQIGNPLLDGFRVADTREQSSVRLRDGVAVRETVRRLTLMTLRTGTLFIAPITVRHGETEVRSPSVTVTVRAPGAGGGALAARIRDLVERLPPPALTRDEVALTVHPTPDSATVGEQMDLVVVAWFPREIRSRLRNPPTLRSPQVTGAWVYHQSVPSGIAASRRVGGDTYDLYVLHDVLFPLVPGRLEIGAATVSYTLPLTYSFLSREVRHEVESARRLVPIAAQPGANRPARFTGASGRAMTLHARLPRGVLPQGQALTAELALQGTGNVALWPEPTVEWPPGLRVYPEDVRVAIRVENGVVGGTKVFRYLLVPDSAGSHRIPPPSYVYFDLDSRRYRVLEGDGVEIVTPGRVALRRSSLAPGPLATSMSWSAARTMDGLPPWLWLIVLLAPPLSAFGLRRLRRRGERTPSRQRFAAEPGTLDALARAFQQMLERLVPDAASREGDRLIDALRAAGIEAPVAQHAARVRDRLRQAVFGPEGATDADELRAEVQEVLRVVGGEAARFAARGGGIAALAVAMVVVVSAPVVAQSPERLYETGAYRAAADSFARRAAGDPLDATHWYNWGRASFELGDTTHARAVWIRAARLAPRTGTIRRDLRRVPLDRTSRELAWIAPLTPAEAFLLAAGLWAGAWLLIGVSERRRLAVLAVAIAIACAGLGQYIQSRYDRAVALVLRDGTPLRGAPYGPAPVGRRLDAGDAVRIESVRGSWLLVVRAGQRGWLLRAEVTTL